MYEAEKYFGKAPADAITRLITYAQYECRALRSCITKEEVKRLRACLVQDPSASNNIYAEICRNENAD